MSDDRILVVDDLVAGYVPEVNILNGCNIEVRAGEFVGVIGPNGAGKSTVLKAILGQCGVRGGKVSFLGNDITGMKAHELVEQGVGYVPQTQNVFQSLNALSTSRHCFQSCENERINARVRCQVESVKWWPWVVRS